MYLMSSAPLPSSPRLCRCQEERRGKQTTLPLPRCLLDLKATLSQPTATGAAAPAAAAAATETSEPIYLTPSALLLSSKSDAGHGEEGTKATKPSFQLAHKGNLHHPSVSTKRSGIGIGHGRSPIFSAAYTYDQEGRVESRSTPPRHGSGKSRSGRSGKGDLY